MSRTTVSICTATYNRRKFIPNLIKCVKEQTYPQECIEWIILDDGTDKIGDLVKEIKNVVYIPKHEKMPIGEKRNMLNEIAKNEIIIYFDDDDFHHPDRIKHSVMKIMGQKKCKIAGSSLMYTFYTSVKELYTLGPYGPNHATAGTFAFHKDLLKETSFKKDKTFGEEKYFLKNYTIPMIQLNPLKTIVVLCHDCNTFDKNQFLEMKNYTYIKKSNIKLKKLIKNKQICNFFKNYK